MAISKRAVDFLDSEEGTNIRQTLIAMLADSGYSTTSSYNANTTLYPDGVIPFVDKHMHYLSTHPSVDPVHYLANLRLITRVR